MNVKVSVIVPVYNVEAYLEECLQSVIGQTFSEIEIIIVNDGSTDGSKGIINRYQASDSRIRVLEQQNRGQSAARNAGLRVAQGEYILFVDSDDYIHKDCIKTLYEHAKQELDLVLYGAHIFTDVLHHERYLHEKNGKIWDMRSDHWKK